MKTLQRKRKGKQLSLGKQFSLFIDNSFIHSKNMGTRVKWGFETDAAPAFVKFINQRRSQILTDECAIT